MKQEKSCGAVIFREDENGRRFYLVITSVKGHVTLCKGHVEKKETERETAKREIMEETGLTVEFVDGFREVITYSPRPGRVKDVVFFLARGLEGKLVCQPEEVADARFLPFDAAMEKLTHLSDRETLEAAEAFLTGLSHAHPAG